jgi:hypothetical protein
MDHVHLCLTDLLDQDLTAYEYFQGLSPEVRRALQEKEISTFDELQSAANDLKKSPFLH